MSTETQPMTEDEEVFYRLAAPVPPDRIKTRQGQGGRQLSYVDAAFVMDRLDEAVGPANWETEVMMAEDHVLCRLIIHLPSGRTLHRDGIGGFPDTEGARGISAEDRPKAGATDAFKRSGVMVGIARNLYEDAAGVHEAHPASREPRRDYAPERSSPPPPRSQGNGNGQAPRTGKALYAWTREQEQKHEVSLLQYLNKWSKLQEFPSRMVDWDADQTALAYEEAMRKLAEVPARHEGN